MLNETFKWNWRGESKIPTWTKQKLLCAIYKVYYFLKYVELIVIIMPNRILIHSVEIKVVWHTRKLKFKKIKI